MDLNSSVSKLSLVGPAYVRRLEKLGISTVRDFLYHVPARYLDFRTKSDIVTLQEGETVTITGRVVDTKNVFTRSRKNFQVFKVEDKTGTINIVFFNQSYLAKTIEKGKTFSFSCKVGRFNRELAMISPQFEEYEEGRSIHTGRLVPVYPETYGVSSKWLRARIFQCLAKAEIKDYLPPKVLAEYNLLPLREAIKVVHSPDLLEGVEEARKRLAFDELLLYQLKSQKRKREWKENKVTVKLEVSDKLISEFVESLPFRLTASQERAISEIFSDLKRETPMNRLLEGDVGSGKTVIAAAAAFATFVNGYQSVVMAPTQILAGQHFNTLKSIFDKFKVRVSLVTSAGKSGDIGKTDIFVGTHALIHKRADFDKVAFVVIDEQHRFGVEQRAHLIKKAGKSKTAPHVLTMTATPIPRTIALTIYGDLDLSTLNEMPVGRQKIITWMVPPQKRESAYEWIKREIRKEKTQVFVICPLIEESEKETMKQVKAATGEYENLKKIFSEFNVGLLHGKQKLDDKNKVLEKFKKGYLDILVATPVVEVGIDVPNAGVMVIEGGERFGLSQLHQLRGRVGRGVKKSYCLLFTTGKSREAQARLSAMTKNYSGFELAEIDLQLRGPGEIYGVRQHGFPNLKIASWQDLELIKLTKAAAHKILANPNSDIKELLGEVTLN